MGPKLGDFQFGFSRRHAKERCGNFGQLFYNLNTTVAEKCRRPSFIRRHPCLRFHDINMYGPTSSFPAGYRNSFFESLYFYLHPTRPSILAGDFTVVANPIIDRFPPSSKYEQSNATNLCKNAGLSHTYRTLYGDSLFYTRRQNQSQSRLDRFYATSTIQLKSECAQPNAFSRSRHCNLRNNEL